MATGLQRHMMHPKTRRRLRAYERCIARIRTRGIDVVLGAFRQWRPRRSWVGPFGELVTR